MISELLNNDKKTQVEYLINDITNYNYIKKRSTAFEKTDKYVFVCESSVSRYGPICGMARQLEQAWR